MTVDRRHILRLGGSWSLAATFAGLAAREAPAAPATKSKLAREVGGMFELPKGFKSVVLDESGTVMSDGFVVPGFPDGMACFAGQGSDLVLMRNHEVGRLDLLNSPYRLTRMPPEQAYDALAGGGVTRVVVDGKTGRVRSRNLVLAGTERNCAGGVSPWGWLSCEESVTAEHGYVFLCDAAATSVQPPVRIVGYGRFNHEAATVDPVTKIAYLTEDRDDGCFYRFVPDRPTDPLPFTGRLEALKIKDAPNFQTASATHAPGASWPVEWVPVRDVNPATDTVRYEAHARGAARVARGEGLWLGGADVYLSSSTGGAQAKGQIFRVRDAASPSARLELVATGDASGFEMPDNITVAPWGDLFVVEDGGGGNSIRHVKPTGETRTFANCVGSLSELAGICFDPKGERLFVNVQKEGLTMMVTGPFSQWAV